MDEPLQTKTINVLYAFLVISTILGFVPSVSAFIASAALWIVVLIAAYLYRLSDNKDGLLYNHMTYLIGTIWISSTLIVLATCAAGAYVFLNGSNAAFDAAMTQAESGVMPTEDSMQGIITQYMADNKSLLISVSLVTIGPALLYLTYRVANGLSRAAKGYRIANPKSWL